MPSSDPVAGDARWRWDLLLAVGLPLAAALWLGQDANWDLRNYHLYNPHALLTGRNADIAPAQLQGWHNPLLDVPMYLLAMSGAPVKLVSVWLALPMMLSLGCLLRLQRLCSHATPQAAARVALVVLALTGAAAWSTLALSMNDGFVAAGMLAALCIALDAPTRVASPQERAVQWALAGVVAGAVTGLKLTGGFYCVALAGAAAVGGAPAERLRRLLALAGGGIAGMAIAYGPWGWHLLQATNNPFFPYFNDVLARPRRCRSRTWTSASGRTAWWMHCSPRSASCARPMRSPN